MAGKTFSKGSCEFEEDSEAFESLVGSNLADLHLNCGTKGFLCELNFERMSEFAKKRT